MSDDPDKAKAYEAATTKAAEDLRAVVRWMIAGVRARAAGVLAGSPLPSLGALGWEPRLWIAAGAGAAVFLLLGWLLWLGISVMAPRSYSTHTIADDIARCHLRKI